MGAAVSFNYPILLDLAGRRAVIVGGGGVALRKARGLLDAGCADVVAVAPVFAGGFPADVKRVAGAYAPCHLEGAFVAFAATDSSDVNDAVVRDARERRILVSRADADDEQPGDFSNPAVYRDGALLVAVSAGGAPALATHVRDEIGKTLDRSLAAMANAMQSVRPRVLGHGGLGIAERRAIFSDLASDEASGVLAASGPEGLWRWLGTRHPRLNAD
jgi:siroheme synthase-like protein